MDRALVLLLAALVSPLAKAAWITLEPDDVPAGTAVTDYWDSVTLRSVAFLGGGRFFESTVSVATSPRAVTGNQTFTPTDPMGIAPWQNIVNPRCYIELRLCGVVSSALVLTFDELVGGVSFLVNFRDGQSLWLFDDDLNEVGVCSSTFGYGIEPCYEYISGDPIFESNWRVTAITGALNVRYAVIGGLAGPGAIDAISYSVPEPSALGLFGVGLIGLTLRRAGRTRRHDQSTRQC